MALRSTERSATIAGRQRELCVRLGLATGFLDLRAALTNLEFRIALANDVHSTTPLDDLAVGVTVLQGADAADNFHGSLSSGGANVVALLMFRPAPETVLGAESEG